MRQPIQQRPYVNPADEDEYKMRLGELLVRAQGPSGDPRLAGDPQLAAVKQLWEPSDDPRVAEMNAMIAPREPVLDYGPAPAAEDGEGQLRKALGAALIGLAVAPLEGVMKRGEQREHQDFQLRLARETAGAEREFRAGETKAEREQRAAMQTERLEAEKAARDQAERWRQQDWEHEKSPAALVRKFGVAQVEAAGGTPAEMAAVASSNVQPEQLPGVQQQLAAEATKHYVARAGQLLTRYAAEGRAGRAGSAVGWTEAEPDWLGDRAVELADEIRKRYPEPIAGLVLRDTIEPITAHLYASRPQVRWSTPKQWEPLVEGQRMKIGQVVARIKEAAYGKGQAGVSPEQIALDERR